MKRGDDHVPRAAVVGSQALGCGTGGGQQPLLMVQQRDVAQQHADHLPARAVGSASSLMTSTSRTTRCRPACRVVWERSELRRSAPIAILPARVRMALRAVTVNSRPSTIFAGRAAVKKAGKLNRYDYAAHGEKTLGASKTTVLATRAMPTSTSLRSCARCVATHGRHTSAFGANASPVRSQKGRGAFPKKYREITKIYIKQKN